MAKLILDIKKKEKNEVTHLELKITRNSGITMKHHTNNTMTSFPRETQLLATIVMVTR